jgi:FKBP-type peptidyl-prolyl cis-trans isomerase FkpA
MLRIYKVGGLLVATGVFVGLGAVGVLYWQRGGDVPVAVKPGSVVLDTAATPVPTAEAGLKVASPESVGANGGGAQMLLPDTANSSSTANTGSTAPSATPSADELGKYQQYSGSGTAMYGDFVVGRGAAVAAGSIVTVNYRGWLTNGKLFDESYTSGKSYSFKEGDHRVIPGWEEGLFGMRAGGKRRVIVPPSKGYGAAEHNGIPANSVLVFDVELVSVQ